MWQYTNIDGTNIRRVHEAVSQHFIGWKASNQGLCTMSQFSKVDFPTPATPVSIKK